MKHQTSALFLVSTLLLTACATDAGNDESMSESNVDLDDHSNLFAYSPEASPLGADMTRWQARWWKWVLSIPSDQNPMFDDTGERCGVGQQGDVFFLATVVGGGTGQTTRTCTVPAHEPILITPAGSLNDFPCPDPSFKPAAGQSLYHFLKAGAVESATATNLIEITLDGVALPGTLGYRTTSVKAFSFTGDVSLASNFDSCITGMAQPAVADGYITMLRGLSTGTHTLVVHATNFHGGDTTLTWTLHAVSHY